MLLQLELYERLQLEITQDGVSIGADSGAIANEH